MKIPTSLYDFKETLQEIFENTCDTIVGHYDSDDEYEISGRSLKAYMIESHKKITDVCIDNFQNWRKFEDADGWYYTTEINNDSSKNKNYFVVDATSNRVWIFYTTISVKDADKIIKKLVKSTTNLDFCWLSRGILSSFKNKIGWKEKGIGLKYRDILADSDDRDTLSIKAWYGSNKLFDWEKFIGKAKENVSVSSIRWKKIIDDELRITSEWYNYGKVTIGQSADIDETIFTIKSIAKKYEDSLNYATKLRDETFGAFELNFSKNIDLDAFSDVVLQGKTALNLWLTETSSEKGFKRFKGVDMHTWDVVFLDMAEDYAYLTIPGNGCVNAVPRMAAIQSEYTSGKTDLYFNGDEIFV